jgi:hypothetical protein
MAQFDILSYEFPSAPPGTVTELVVTVDNPENMQEDEAIHSVLPDVEIVPEGSSPTQSLWVHANSCYLTIVLVQGNAPSPLSITNTEYFNQGSGAGKYVDILVAEKGDDGKKKTRKIRRMATIVFV